jgi:hypothetical protein
VFIKSIEGDLTPGGKLKVKLQQQNGNVMNMTPTLLVYRPNEELRWKGVFGANFLFGGEHYFIIEQLSLKTCLFVHGERFNGALLPFLTSMLNETQKSFEQFNSALKKEAEATASQLK